jgi:hypothetical protein
MQTPHKPAAIGQGGADALGQRLRRLEILDDVFNGRLRNELLNETLFTSLMQARLALEDWRRDYNTVRPYSRIGWPTPAAHATQFSPQRAKALRCPMAPRPDTLLCLRTMEETARL